VVTLTHRGGHEFPPLITDYVVTFLKENAAKP
jgi:hypothetical protein